MFCQECGAEISDKAVVCPKCGVPVAGNQPASAYIPPRKSRAVFVLLGLFFGLLGFHDFYAGYVLRGVLQLLCTTFLGWLVIPLFIDAFFIIIELIVTTKDGNGVEFA